MSKGSKSIDYMYMVYMVHSEISGYTTVISTETRVEINKVIYFIDYFMGLCMYLYIHAIYFYLHICNA